MEQWTSDCNCWRSRWLKQKKRVRWVVVISCFGYGHYSSSGRTSYSLKRPGSLVCLFVRKFSFERYHPFLLSFMCIPRMDRVENFKALVDSGSAQQIKSEQLGSAAPIIYLSRFDPSHSFSGGERIHSLGRVVGRAVINNRFRRK